MIVSKVKSKYIFKDIRFSAGYFLNEDAANSLKLEENASMCAPLSDLATVWNPPIFKRQFCQNTNKAIPYCQSSDVNNAIEGSDVYINKAQALKVGSVVSDKDILVTGFGTIGSTRLVNELSNGISYANNVCRIRVKDNSKYGFIYAFMTSKYGRSQLNKNASGSVVRYIEAPGIKKTLIPIFSESKQEEIHKLVQEASVLRVEANKLLREADTLFLRNLNIDQDLLSQLTHPSESATTLSFKVARSQINSLSIRSRTYSERLKIIRSSFQSLPYTKLIDLLEYPAVKGGRYKRVEVSLDSINAVELLNQGDLHDLKPKGKIISKKYIDNIENQTAVKNMIIVPAVGTLGENEIFSKPLFVYGYLEGKVLSEHLLRIMPDSEKIAPGYLFTVLKSKLFFRVFRSLVYGTNLLYYILPLLHEFPIPRLSEIIESEIDQKVKMAYEKLTIGNTKENKAIAIVEKEIESWQK